jgi:hypothetical protein
LGRLRGRHGCVGRSRLFLSRPSGALVSPESCLDRLCITSYDADEKLILDRPTDMKSSDVGRDKISVHVQSQCRSGQRGRKTYGRNVSRQLWIEVARKRRGTFFERSLLDIERLYVRMALTSIVWSEKLLKHSPPKSGSRNLKHVTLLV